MGIGTYIRLGIGLAFILLLGWALRLDALRADWRDKFMGLRDEAGQVLASIRIASDNPDLKWADAADQVEALDASLTQWRGTAKMQSATIDALGAESARLRAENAVMAERVAVLNARRNAAIARLQDDALDAGDREDCWAQVREAEDALNQIYQEGF